MPTRIRLFGDTQRADQYRFQVYRKHLADALMLRGFQNLPIYRHQARLPEGGMVDIVCHHNFNEIAIYMPREEEAPEQVVEREFLPLFTSTDYHYGDEKIFKHDAITLIKVLENNVHETGRYGVLSFSEGSGLLFGGAYQEIHKIYPGDLSIMGSFDLSGVTGGYVTVCCAGSDGYIYGAREASKRLSKVNPSDMNEVEYYTVENDGNIYCIDFLDSPNIDGQYVLVGITVGGSKENRIVKLDTNLNFVSETDDLRTLVTGLSSNDDAVYPRNVVSNKEGNIFANTDDDNIDSYKCYLFKFSGVTMNLLKSAYISDADSIYSLATKDDQYLFVGGTTTDGGVTSKLNASDLSLDSYNNSAGIGVYDIDFDNRGYLYGVGPDEDVSKLDPGSMKVVNAYKTGRWMNALALSPITELY